MPSPSRMEIYRSPSRERERRDGRVSRDRGSERGYRDRSRDRYRDKERRRERDGERAHRSTRHDGPDGRHGYRDRDRERDRDDNRERRRKRGDDYEGSERGHDDKVKRKKSEVLDDLPPPPPPPDLPPPPPPRGSPFSVRSSDRRNGEEYDDSSRVRRDSPAYASYEPPVDEPYNPDEPKEDDSEARSVFVSQLAARLTAKDLGYFFEDKLGEGTVMDSRIVTDRLSRRSKGFVHGEMMLQLLAD